MADEKEFTPEPKIWLLIILVLLLLGGSILFFSRSNPDIFAQQPRVTPTRQARIYTVAYDAGVFSPTNIRIHAGDSVRFQNVGDEPIRIVSDDRDGAILVGFDSLGDIPPEGVFTYTFVTTGTYGYHNAYVTSEQGRVTVRP